MTAFVIEYNRRTGSSVVHQFDSPNGSEAAMNKRCELEDSRTDSDVEIVSLVSSSIDAIRHTHSRYFAHHVELV